MTLHTEADRDSVYEYRLEFRLGEKRVPYNNAAGFMVLSDVVKVIGIGHKHPHETTFTRRTFPGEVRLVEPFIPLTMDESFDEQMGEMRRHIDKLMLLA